MQFEHYDRAVDEIHFGIYIITISRVSSHSFELIYTAVIDCIKLNNIN